MSDMTIEEEASVWEEGYVAFQDDLELTDNPYNPNIDGVDFVLWRTGWFDAQREADEDDGQPDEAQEWADFDPDC
jgi:hypothetical protein